ncbi:MAG: insulinase family protein [Thermoguttaceae bacterium]|nr:insulinase family protein [Thermoguttaceae bacterium]MDW8036956.1 pitrilysin family protein [Thermoguttaceae bacterium]
MWSVAMMIGMLFGGAVSTESPSRIPQIPFEKYSLPNGLQVILHQDCSTPIVCVNLWYHVGSKDEQIGRTGFAHLFEHMMFQGSEHYDQDYFKPLQEAGGRLNGSTSQDRTNYWQTVPSNYLELALWMESDRMGYLLPAMTQEKLDNQRDVVKNERRQAYENRPYGLVYETILAALYPPEHPYSWPTIGYMEDLDRASREDIAQFFRCFYHPANASLCIAGDFDPAEAKRLVAKYFGGIPAGPKPVRRPPPMPRLSQEQRIRMTDRVGLGRLYLVWPTAVEFSQDDAALELLAGILSAPKIGRLEKRLVRQLQLAQDVSASQQGQEWAGTFWITATVRAGQSMAQLENALLEEIQRIQQQPPSEEELQQALHRLESAWIGSLQSVGGFGGRADQLNYYNVMTGDPGNLSRDFERFVRVRPEDIQRVAQQYLTSARVVLEVQPGQTTTIEPDPRIPAAKARKTLLSQATSPSPYASEGSIDEASSGPKASSDSSGPKNFSSPSGKERDDGRHHPASADKQAEINPKIPKSHQSAPSPLDAEHAATIEQPDRTRLPPPGPPPKFTFPPFSRFQLSNGLEVVFAEYHELPLVICQMLFRAGRSSDPAGKAGLAHLMAAVWDEGTQKRSGEELAAALARLGASLSIGADWDTSGARLFTLRRSWTEALRLYAEVICQPLFPENQLDREKQLALGRLRQWRADPVMVAHLAFCAALYGPDHPYGQPSLGTPSTIQSIGRHDLEQFYRQHIRPNRATLIVVGDLSQAELATELEKAFGHWKATEPPASQTPAESASAYPPANLRPPSAQTEPQTLPPRSLGTEWSEGVGGWMQPALEQPAASGLVARSQNAEQPMCEGNGRWGPPLPEPPPIHQSRLLVLDKPAAPQSVICVGQLGARRNSPEYARLVVMNTIFGGQFSSRLNMNLRETHGFTYGARSAFDWRPRQPGPFAAVSSVHTEVTAQALQEFLNEIEGLRGAKPVSLKELEFAKNYLCRGYPADFETASQLAEHLETLLEFDLPDDAFSRFIPEVQAVQPEDVHQIAQKFLQVDRLLMVIVGDRTKIEPALRQLPVGRTLQVVELDEAFRLVPVDQQKEAPIGQ